MPPFPKKKKKNEKKKNLGERSASGFDAAERLWNDGSLVIREHKFGFISLGRMETAATPPLLSGRLGMACQRDATTSKAFTRRGKSSPSPGGDGGLSIKKNTRW